ncbi:polyketide cyclase/dehydrase/lipid transport protein [Streptomyces sp. 1114.5]|uniref:SRPBCC family protein n=1 Tax=unclassified Streptomyces TaxID=2593676 RepID=UPI000BD78CE4|nr:MULTISPECIES: SRPBCC family protein [unclassified Streptomyces]RKT09258.1 polyketide cyclase/dehydrase/lipid transport protein [Streptomyces sp. 1114.5]SOB88749.1 Polyketide cyclase / dehydrase and lipid transport [Streptomyces sp. 1331.2]
MRTLTAATTAAVTVALLLTTSTAASALTTDRPTAAAEANVQIDQQAPVITRTDILIHAPLHTVWKIQTDVENWPTWQPNVERMTKDTPGRLRPGSVFRWSTEGLDITSTVKQVIPCKRLVWGGPAQGITAVHVWTFTPTRDGVLVHTEESWTGEPVTANQAVLQAALDTSLHHWVTNLKHEAEAQATR